ncbi:methyl coenzyme M reductase system subunit A2 [Methanohalophilus euhalobius]|uniref:Methyl coenzyme M reductase system subunit A2 n=1 Tax=Methanohalophilus euhalobius TaxID=51203 RepID=A0A285GC62_9EURY|nr:MULTISPECIES: ATP-binding cassette domain-containing protein [Methanohalophilus]ODV50237.1 MAG: methyl coenzyme M reductase system, component A2 [Methanohalophilus sp. 2-GBenrich]RSD36395.1 MAG: methyl coenzyme M reductase system, component A2 [Methanohalophilus sp.]TCL12144.1 methyl coenzyme M reductase system subunit A2 [Methanohalophilus euhalobius]SNY21169.1 methyl coenzyme M reductase system, component A2 [Methanohalophilus euhalobius]
MLKVKGISKIYDSPCGKKQVLEDISFTVQNGEILGITGKSGSGKSTLLKILRGIETFDSGTIEIDETAISPDMGQTGQRFLMSNSALHLQRNFSLWSGKAVENIIRRLYYAREGYEALPDNDHPLYDEMYEEAMAYLGIVGLKEKALHFSGALSGGEKQRLILARQLASRPSVLLLDEPVTMAGPDSKQQILDIILLLKEKLNIPILVVSHLPEILSYLADDMLCIDEGKIVASGDSGQVLDKFLHGMADKKPLGTFSEEVCVRAENLAKRYSLWRVGEVLDLKDISLSVNRGEILGLIGPSGSGKTTLLRMLAGLLEPQSGRVLYSLEDNWIDISRFSPQRMEMRRRMSIMHQEFTLSPHSTIGQHIAFKLRLKRQGAIEHARQKAEELGISEKMLDTIYQLPDMAEAEKEQSLSKMGLTPQVYLELFPAWPQLDVAKYAEPVFDALDLSPDILEKKPAQISGGEHVRSYIAVSLATSPDILMLDEPFGDLDPITLRDVTNSLKEINRRFGTTIVFVSHHMDFVKEVAHRAVLLSGGSVIEEGDARQVCDNFIESTGVTYIGKGIDGMISK